jgi:hypothetical protein
MGLERFNSPQTRSRVTRIMDQIKESPPSRECAQRNHARSRAAKDSIGSAAIRWLATVLSCLRGLIILLAPRLGRAPYQAWGTVEQGNTGPAQPRTLPPRTDYLRDRTCHPDRIRAQWLRTCHPYVTVLLDDSARTTLLDPSLNPTKGCRRRRPGGGMNPSLH